jgi:hypothetical protein
MLATIPSGSVRGLLRSKMTSDGRLARISASAASRDFATKRAAPICFAVDRILDVKSKSSRIARITP